MSLPKDILENIFARLPVTDIARSRVVCESWRSLLSSEDFLVRYKISNDEKWVAVFDENGLNKERMLILYNASLKTWHHVSLCFLPNEFTYAVASSGGLLCVAGQPNGKNVLCVCNPFTRCYKILPELDQEPSIPVVVMIESKKGHTESGKSHEKKRNMGAHFQILALRGDVVALYSTKHGNWQAFNTGLPYRPRSPVACEGIVYGLQNMGSPWKSSWRLVYAKLNELCCKEVWCAINRPEWGEILDILRQPRLLESNSSLLLTGGLRRGVANFCSTFIILKLDLISLEWSEAQRMPFAFYKHFDPGADFKIFGGRGMVYFSSKNPGKLVACDLSGSGDRIWSWVEGCPSNYQKNGLCKGFPLKPRFDLFP